MDKKVSVIIPAHNESDYIEKSLKKYREQNYAPLEIIVVDNSTDGGKTRDIAENYADKVLSFSGALGLSIARNKGAKAAEGEVLIFSDADSFIEKGGVKKVAEITDEHTIGTFWSAGDSNNIKGKAFFLLKNLIHWFRIYKGVGGGVLFCHRNVFLSTGGFDAKKEPAELFDFIRKARKNGAAYKLILNYHATTSLRRYEKKGYLNVIIFWIKWRIKSIFKKGEATTEDYFYN